MTKSTPRSAVLAFMQSANSAEAGIRIAAPASPATSTPEGRLTLATRYRRPAASPGTTTVARALGLERVAA